MRAIRLFGSRPDVALTVCGNPAALGNPYNHLPLGAALRSGQRGDFTERARPMMNNLLLENVKECEFLGYSFGADIAAEATILANKYALVVPRAVCAEPASTAWRGLTRLGRDFMKAGKQQQKYVADADSPPLNEARAQADTGLVRYLGGLLRPNNLGAAWGLTDTGFRSRAQLAVKANPELQLTVAWGSQSELSNDTFMQTTADELIDKFPKARITPLRLAEAHHAACDDIDLHAAIMLETAPR